MSAKNRLIRSKWPVPDSSAFLSLADSFVSRIADKGCAIFGALPQLVSGIGSEEDSALTQKAAGQQLIFLHPQIEGHFCGIRADKIDRLSAQLGRFMNWGQQNNCVELCKLTTGHLKTWRSWSNFQTHKLNQCTDQFVKRVRKKRPDQCDKNAETKHAELSPPKTADGRPKCLLHLVFGYYVEGRVAHTNLLKSQLSSL